MGGGAQKLLNALLLLNTWFLKTHILCKLRQLDLERQWSAEWRLASRSLWAST